METKNHEPRLYMDQADAAPSNIKVSTKKSTFLDKYPQKLNVFALNLQPEVTHYKLQIKQVILVFWHWSGDLTQLCYNVWALIDFKIMMYSSNCILNLKNQFHTTFTFTFQKKFGKVITSENITFRKFFYYCD